MRKVEKKEETEEKKEEKKEGKKALKQHQTASEARNIAIMQIFVKTLTGTTSFHHVILDFEEMFERSSLSSIYPLQGEKDGDYDDL